MENEEARTISKPEMKPVIPATTLSREDRIRNAHADILKLELDELEKGMVSKYQIEIDKFKADLVTLKGELKKKESLIADYIRKVQFIEKGKVTYDPEKKKGKKNEDE